MPPRNVYAYTAPGADFPEFISINVNADGNVVVTARAPKAFGGQVVDVPLPYEQLTEMLYRLRDERRMHVMSMVAVERERDTLVKGSKAS